MDDSAHVILIGGNDGTVLEVATTDVPIILFQLPSRASEIQIRGTAMAFHFDYPETSMLFEVGRAVMRQRRLGGVVSFLDRGLLPAARLSEHLGLPGNPVLPVENSLDKLRFRQATFKLCPADIAELRGDKEAVEFFAGVGAPIVIKPRFGSGSRGVSYVDNAAAARMAYAHASCLGDGYVIAERFVDGPEYSVESFSMEGAHQILGITRKISSGPPHFVELGHDFPAPLSAADGERLGRMTLQMLDCLGHQQGPAHTEARLTPDGVFLIETQSRHGGDQIWEMVKLVTGISQAQLTIAHLTRSQIPAPRSIAKAAAIRFFALENCRVEHIRGLEDARGMRGIVRVVCHLHPGQSLGSVKCSADRQGYVMGIGASVEDARQCVADAWRSILIETREPE